jgi:hypothetical protein
MKYKISILFFLGFIIITLVVNSCKKDPRGTITSLFTGGRWQLASELVTYTNFGVTTIDTLNLKCDSTQIFTFNTNHTCTYSNFDCIATPSPPKGNWSLSADQLTLYSTIICRDTTAKHTSMPFDTVQIVNLGQYSMVLQTGNFNVIPTTLNKTRVVRYGFVRQKTIN